MEIINSLRKVAFVGDYSPRQCGIATFTSNLRCAIAEEFPEIQCPVVAVTDSGETYDYPMEVRFEVAERDVQSYLRAADSLNLANADVVCLQHEFGIYGGSAGSHILGLLRAVRIPVVTTLHTVLEHPNPEQRKAFSEVIRLSARVVVMAQKAQELLRNVYGVPDQKVDVIPHGIPDIPFIDPSFYKDKFGVEGKTVLLTFGLLSPGKGIEYLIEALPEIVKCFPGVVYVILGATHPNLVREQGQSYRLSLERLAKKLDVGKHVMFFNRFVEMEELIEFIGAADVYVTPYLNEAQITSGTLAYAFGAGKAVVSTPYWHASELLAGDRGVLTPFRDARALASAIVDLLKDDARRNAMRKAAWQIGREMIWPRVAQAYAGSFARARNEHSPLVRAAYRPPTLDLRREALPSWKFHHLRRLTDGTGILQHSVYTVPRIEEGYCTDDNARALILTMWVEDLDEEMPGSSDLAATYAAFLNGAFQAGSGRFRNFMAYDRRWLEDVGSEDSHGRALWALGTVVGRCTEGPLREWAAELFELALPVVEGFDSPRSWAFAILGMHEYLRTLNGDLLALRMRSELSSRLAAGFDAHATPDWEWLEDSITYDNARICQALILTGRWTGDAPLLERGLRSLRWLMDAQKGAGGCFRPVGTNGFWRKGYEPAVFDQQPIEACAAIGACIEAFNSTNDPAWCADARRAFDWFLGANDLNLPLCNVSTGGCRDGLHMDRTNRNECAESTLAFLMALAEMKDLEEATVTFQDQAANSV